MAEKARYAPSSQQRDLEARLENGNRSSRVLSTSDNYEAPEGDEGRSFAVEGNDLDGYVNTSPEYMTYANETEKPMASEEGVEAELEEKLAKAQAGATDEVVSSGDTEDEEEDEDSSTETDPKKTGGTTDPSAAARAFGSGSSGQSS